MTLVFLILAFVLLLVAAFLRPGPPQVELAYLGLAFFMLAQIWPIAVR